MSRSYYFFSFLLPECMFSHKVCHNPCSKILATNPPHLPTRPPQKNSHGDLRPINFFSSPLIYTFNYFRQFNTRNNNNLSCIVYAKMKRYGTHLYPVTCTGVLLISSGRFTSYFQVKVLLKGHSKTVCNESRQSSVQAIALGYWIL